MSRGFTLAEIVVVLAILGITAAVVVPAFTRLAPDDDLSRAAGQPAKRIATVPSRSFKRPLVRSRVLVLRWRSTAIPEVTTSVKPS